MGLERVVHRTRPRPIVLATIVAAATVLAGTAPAASAHAPSAPAPSPHAASPHAASAHAASAHAASAHAASAHAASAHAASAHAASAHAGVVQAAVSGHDTPAGFWYGTDSSQINIPGPAPYQEPVIGGSYGGGNRVDGHTGQPTPRPKNTVLVAPHTTPPPTNHTSP